LQRGHCRLCNEASHQILRTALGEPDPDLWLGF
jgi:hypothetical protein